MLFVLTVRMPRSICFISPVMRSALPMKTRSVFARADADAGRHASARARRTNRANRFTCSRGGSGGLFLLVEYELEYVHQADADDHAGAKDPQKIHRAHVVACLLYTSPSPRDRQKSRMPSSA